MQILFGMEAIYALWLTQLDLVMLHGTKLGLKVTYEEHAFGTCIR